MPKFVKLAGPHLIGFRHYPAGSVVETDDHRAADLVKHGGAEIHPGPAWEPEPDQAEPEEDADGDAGQPPDPVGDQVGDQPPAPPARTRGRNARNPEG